MTVAAQAVENRKAADSLAQWKAGRTVQDDWYRYILNRHAKGDHEGNRDGNPLCPACQET